jgi:hypothetical protein
MTVFLSGPLTLPQLYLLLLDGLLVAAELLFFCFTARRWDWVSEAECIATNLNQNNDLPYPFLGIPLGTTQVRLGYASEGEVEMVGDANRNLVYLLDRLERSNFLYCINETPKAETENKCRIFQEKSAARICFSLVGKSSKFHKFQTSTKFQAD